MNMIMKSDKIVNYQALFADRMNLGL